MLRLMLVRHTAVDEAYAGRCYGALDVALSAAGKLDQGRLVPLLAAWRPQWVFHSELVRTRELAVAVAAAAGAAVRADVRLRERHFGTWEGCTWDAIYQEDPRSLDRLIEEPDTFAPPGGETTLALRDRVWAWYRELPAEARVLAVTHGGPIAVLRGTLEGCDPSAWPRLIPALGASVELP
jgi:broad specificity phosphatase PhoE